MARSPLGYKVEWITAHDCSAVMCGNPFRLVSRRGDHLHGPSSPFPVLRQTPVPVYNLHRWAVYTSAIHAPAVCIPCSSEAEYDYDVFYSIQPPSRRQ